MTNMRIAKTVSITLPPDLLVKAQEVAQREHRTISELFREALRRYMATDPEWDALLRRTRTTGRALGIESEARSVGTSSHAAKVNFMSRSVAAPAGVVIRVVADTNIYISHAVMFGRRPGAVLDLPLSRACHARSR